MQIGHSAGGYCELAHGYGFDAGMRLVAELGDGMNAFRWRGTMTPFLGMRRSAGGSDLPCGVGWTPGEALRVGDDALAPLAAAGDFANVGPDEPAAHSRIGTVRADGPGRATLVRLLAVKSGRRILRAADPGFPDTAVTRASETMMRTVAVFVGREVRGAAPVTTGPAAGSGRRRLPRHVAGWGDPVVTVR